MKETFNETRNALKSCNHKYFEYSFNFYFSYLWDEKWSLRISKKNFMSVYWLSLSPHINTWLKIISKSTHVIEQLPFSIFSSTWLSQPNSNLNQNLNNNSTYSCDSFCVHNLQETTFVCTIATDNFCLHLCNWKHFKHYSNG